MSNRNKGKAKYSLAWLCVLLFIILTYCSTALNIGTSNFHISLSPNRIDSPPAKLPQRIDTPKIKNSVPTILPDPSVRQPDTAKFTINEKGDTIYRKNSIDSFSLYKMSKDTLSGPVVYHADDSMVLDVPTKKMYLYGKVSSIKYTDNELAAPEIEYDQATGLVRAHLKRDSAGKVISFVSYNQGDGFKSVMDSIVLNMRTLKGVTKGTYTQQGEIFVSGKTIKKVGKDVFYALDSKFTTCNLDTPHFAFVSHKIKFISGKWAFSGPVHPEFEGVPVPIVLPFGIYPLATGRHSGLLAPTFAASDQYGISLENLGYYKVFSPNWDLITQGTLYSYGGWAVNLNPRYYKRYHYQGNLLLQVQKTKPLDVPSQRTINLSWSHTMDTKARPGVSFTANVRAGSTKFNSLVPNSATQNYTNQMQSSITYQKTWKDKPYNIIVSANHDQDNATGRINIHVPEIAFNVSTLYPFRRKDESFVGDYKWYENIGIALQTNAKSFTFFNDSVGHITQQIKDNLQWGAMHTVPISLSLPPVGVFQVTPGISYSEKWYGEQYFKIWNPSTAKVDTFIRKGFWTEREMSFSLGATTRIFGMYSFDSSSKVRAIRHEIRPSIGISYKPDLAKSSYYRAQIDNLKDSTTYSKYERSIYGPYGQGEFGGLTFSIDNNISMKVRNRKDTSNGGTKKITLIDGLRLDGGYNFLVDSFRFSNLSLSARSNLFDKINITAGATIDPYQRNDLNKRIDRLIIRDRPYSLGSLSSASVSLQSGFKGGDKSKQTNPQLNDPNMMQQNAGAIGMPLTDYEQEAAYIRNNPGEFVDFSIPWSVDFTYSLIYSKTYQENTTFRPIKSLNQALTFNGSINLTPKWKLGVNGSYNVSLQELGLISMYLSREMHCWQMTINVSRSDQSRYFTINISPKSPMLRDLKVNRTRYFVGN